MSLFEWFGVISGFILSFSAIPQVAKCYLQGHTKGLSTTYLATWLVGSFGSAFYLITKFGFDPAIIANYSLCCGCAVIINYIHWRK